MKDDGANKNIITVIFDLQAVLQLPKGDVSLFYYSQKLNDMNFTFLNSQNMKGDCYVWDESRAKRWQKKLARVYITIGRKCYL